MCRKKNYPSKLNKQAKRLLWLLMTLQQVWLESCEIRTAFWRQNLLSSASGAPKIVGISRRQPLGCTGEANAEISRLTMTFHTQTRSPDRTVKQPQMRKSHFREGVREMGSPALKQTKWKKFHSLEGPKDRVIHDVLRDTLQTMSNLCPAFPPTCWTRIRRVEEAFLAHNFPLNCRCFATQAKTQSTSSSTSRFRSQMFV